MKKSLLLIAAITVSFCAQAQDSLLNEDCSALTVGNVGTDLTGATPGQGGWYTLVTAGAPTNTDFQVVDKGAPYGNTFQITGSASATGTRNMYQDVSSIWSARTAGNDIAEVEVDFYTGPATTSTNNARILLYNTDRTQIVGGLYIAMNTLVISGISYYDNAGTINNFIFRLGAGGTDVVLTADTWYKFGFSFNFATGDVLFRESTGLFDSGVTGAAVGSDVGEFFIQMGAGTGNTLSAVVNFDNLVSRMSATDTLLGNKQVTLPDNKFSVSPNPSNSVIKVSNTENINVSAIAITDLNGRIVKQLSFNGSSDIQVNVSDLATGMYLMKITSDKGVATKKIIKN